MNKVAANIVKQKKKKTSIVILTVFLLVLFQFQCDNPNVIDIPTPPGEEEPIRPEPPIPDLPGDPGAGDEGDKIDCPEENNNKNEDCIIVPNSTSNDILVEREYILMCYIEGEYIHTCAEKFSEFISLDVKRFLDRGYLFTREFSITGYADGLENRLRKKWGDVPPRIEHDRKRKPEDSINDEDLALLRALLIVEELKTEIANLPFPQPKYKVEKPVDIPTGGPIGPKYRKVKVIIILKNST